MATHLMCLTAVGGVPVFTRTTGDAKQLPFPVIGSLNGVHMFCKNHDVELQACVTEDTKVVWKNYKDSLSLLVVTPDDNTSDVYLSRFLDIVCQCMVLLYGEDDLSNIKNIERFKRDIKVCYSLIDYLLSDINSSHSFTCTTACVDVILGAESSILQTYLEAFVNAASSPFGFLLVNGSVAAATSKWWSMDALERIVLVMFINSLSRSCSRDLPVFLPVTSPNVPHRLLTFELIGDVEVAVICGPTPTLAQLQPEVERFWRSSYEALRSLSRLSPVNYPNSISLDRNLLGFMLENTDGRRCLSSVHISHATNTDKSLDSLRRRQILVAFYKQVMNKLWPPRTVMSPTEQDDVPRHSCDSEWLSNTAVDSYICATTHKCYVLWSPPYRLFALYNTNIPTYAMRSMTSKTLQLLLNDKNVVL